MGAFVTLLLLCVLMLGASFLAGLAPVSFNLTPERIQRISSLGIGILVGTSLIVIIPEGVETLYQAGSMSGQEQSADAHRRCVGISLIGGFIFMYLIDQVPHLLSRMQHKSEFVSVAVELPRFGESQERRQTSPQPAGGISRSMSTTIGLVIHAVADGVALGASVATENPALEMMVFIAIMVHKAPASFGFTSVLQREGLDLGRIKKYLAIFAAGAPVGALGTFGLIKLVGSDTADLQTWSGILLLVSGGTFLYVAMHAMQEVHENETTGLDLFLSAAGMAVPLLTLLIPDMG
ncbi:metal homeostasis factor Atx2p [Trichomonascus vanleenenianus]|uniref:Mn(2+) transporter ATX2 n=1 Tax=Trichomonascus vanleenenianus TaxID=2268995 RepID=UPI003ECAE009